MDLYLRTATEADMNEALIAAGLAYEEDGIIHPAPFVSLDVIGPIIRVIGYDEDGDPITQEYPGWHVNVRADLTDEQIEALAAVTIVPPEVPYRVWA